MKPEDIENREFLVSLRGYARDEVDAFKVEVARAIRTLQNRLSDTGAALEIARSEAAAAVSELDTTRKHLAEAKAAPAERLPVAVPAGEPRVDIEPTDPRSDAFRRVALETEKILMAAEEVSEELHEKAMREAAGIVTDARLRAEKIFAEVENAKRAAQQELERIRESRSMIASQMEDIGRRLAETVARLRVPVESPQRQAARARIQGDVPRQGGERPAEERPQPDRHAAERQAAERQVVERQAVERQAAAERAAIEQQAAAERAASERQSAEAERRATERAAAERAAAEERHAAELAALQKTAELSASIRETVARASAMSEAASKALPAPAPPKAPATKPAKVTKEPASPPPAAEPPESSSLNQLLEEIRRTRESKPAEPAAAEPAAAPAAVAVAVDEGPDPMLEQRAAALGDLPAQASRRLKRLLQEDHNDLLDRLRTRRGKGTIDENLAPLPEQFERFQAGLSDALTKAFAEGRKAAGSSGTADAGKAVSNLVARQVVNPLRAEISKAVQVGLEVQDTPTAIAERASDVFRVWKGVRTELLGEGMVYAAFNQGLINGWSRNPTGKKAWVPSPEEECPNEVCQKNVAAGPVGLKATFPSGHLTPPAHGGCTCTLKSV